jgi:hypothetical protein
MTRLVAARWRWRPGSTQAECGCVSLAHKRAAEDLGIIESAFQVRAAANKRDDALALAKQLYIANQISAALNPEPNTAGRTEDLVRWAPHNISTRLNHKLPHGGSGARAVSRARVKRVPHPAARRRADTDLEADESSLGLLPAGRSIVVVDFTL